MGAAGTAAPSPADRAVREAGSPAEGGGKPLVLLLTEGQRHEQTAFEALMVDGSVRRYSRGRPRHRPGRLVGDKGYSGRRVRRYLRRHGIAIAIPYRHNERWGRPWTKLPTGSVIAWSAASIGSSSSGAWPLAMRSWPSTTWR
jgi:hypothetical protein